MKFKPLRDRILVRRIEEKSVTPGGIIIPDNAKEKPIEGEVIATGDGKILENGSTRPLGVKPGDRILFGKYTGAEIELANEPFLILRDEDVLGTIRKEA